MPKRIPAVLIFMFTPLLAAAAPQNFRQGVTLPTLAGPLASVTGDFNGDGHADLIISNTAVSSISVLLGNGDGTFRPRADYPVSGCQVGQTITGDFNRDGRLDVLGTCTLTNNLFVLPGHGDGTFGSPILSPAPFPIVSGFLDGFVEPLTSTDVDSDGIPDLALIIQTAQSVGLSTGGAVGQAVIMAGSGNGSFHLKNVLTIAPAGTEAYAVQLADVNADGKADIVGIAFQYGASGLSEPLTAYFFVALGDGHGSFALAHSYPLTGIPQTGMLLGDINGDGKLDVVFSGLSIAAILDGDLTDFSGVGVFLGGGDGTFTKTYAVQDAQTVQFEGQVGSVLAPVLKAGFPDIVSVELFQNLTNNNEITGGVTLRPNLGNGTFGPAQPVTTPSAMLPFSLSVGDFNGDGKPDLAVFDFSVNLFDLLFESLDPDHVDLTGQGIATFPPAVASILLNAGSSANVTITNAASYQTGALAAFSIATAFGTGLSATTASAEGATLPLTLGGTSVLVTDSANNTRSAPLFYVSPTQINFALPDGTVLGPATVAIAGPGGTQGSAQSIAAVQPGVFNVSGLAIGQVFTYIGSTGPVVTSTVEVGANGQFSSVPIDVGGGSVSSYLILYATGVRNHSTAVTASIGGMSVPVAFAGAQGAFVGEDQINILLPTTLRGAGLIAITLNVDGQVSNAVKVFIQ